MGFFQSIRYKLATAISPGVLPAIKAGRLNYLFTGQSIQVLPMETATYIKAYCENDIIFAVQDWKSTKVAAAPPMLFQVKNQKAFRSYKELRTKNDINAQLQAKELKAIALESVDVHPMLDVLEHPNPFQTRTELFYELSAMLDVVGTTFLYGIRRYKDKGPILELWRLPEIGMQVEGLGLQNTPTAYRSVGIAESLPASNVLMMRRFNPKAMLTNNWWWGMSRLEPLLLSVITKSDYANKAEAELFQNRGQRDLIFPENGDMDDESLERMIQAKDDLNNRLRAPERILGFSAKLGSIKVGSSPVDLNLNESQDLMLEKTCSVYHTRKEVHSSGKQSTFNNLSEARKSSLTDGVLPDQALLYDWFNTFFVSSYNTDTEQYYMEPDLDYYPELQADQKTKAEYLSKLPLKPNQMLEAFGYEVDTEYDFMNVPMIPAGITPITDISMSQITQEAAPNDGTYNDPARKP